MESRISETVASYNQQLTQDPHDEELWLKYVDYQVGTTLLKLLHLIHSLWKPTYLTYVFVQDEVKKFEKMFRKAKEHSSAITDKKLSILDKALTHNPLSEILLLRKLDLLHEMNDLDKVSEIMSHF